LTAGVEYLVRAARVTDVDRLVALAASELGSGARNGALASGDLLRQLVYLPQASVLVAEVRRGIVGGAVLALRPSVRAGGYIGTVDLLVVDPEQDADRITEALVEDLLRSAANKGCSLVEAPRPSDEAVLERWTRSGFREAGATLERDVTAARSGRRT
jgi:predicted N-acetyltransferase YhbS